MAVTLFLGIFQLIVQYPRGMALTREADVDKLFHK